MSKKANDRTLVAVLLRFIRAFSAPVILLVLWQLHRFRAFRKRLRRLYPNFISTIKPAQIPLHTFISTLHQAPSRPSCVSYLRCKYANKVQVSLASPVDIQRVLNQKPLQLTPFGPRNVSPSSAADVMNETLFQACTRMVPELCKNWHRGELNLQDACDGLVFELVMKNLVVLGKPSARASAEAMLWRLAFGGSKAVSAKETAQLVSLMRKDEDDTVPPYGFDDWESYASFLVLLLRDCPKVLGNTLFHLCHNPTELSTLGKEIDNRVGRRLVPTKLEQITPLTRLNQLIVHGGLRFRDVETFVLEDTLDIHNGLGENEDDDGEYVLPPGTHVHLFFAKTFDEEFSTLDYESSTGLGVGSQLLDQAALGICRTTIVLLLQNLSIKLLEGDGLESACVRFEKREIPRTL